MPPFRFTLIVLAVVAILAIGIGVAVWQNNTHVEDASYTTVFSTLSYDVQHFHTFIYRKGISVGGLESEMVNSFQLGGRSSI